MKDPYQVLGVNRTASAADIKSAYRRLARERHPDRAPGDPRAAELFKDLSAAYDLLSNPGKRARYDRGEIDADGNPSGNGGFGTNPSGRKGPRNPFEGMFRSRSGRGGGSIKVKGANVTYRLSVPFLEAARGAVKRIAMANGKHLNVSIPPGTEDAQTLRLKGQGMPGIGGSEHGDALVEITVEPHPYFSRQGHDIHCEIPVSLSEAVLGGKIEVPTIDGSVTVTVPEASNTGTILRLKGKGLATKDKKEGRGDHYVTLKVVLPDKQDTELTEFVRKWGAGNPYDARRNRMKTD